MAGNEGYVKPERWMLPCRYCRKNPCPAEQYEDVIQRSLEELPDWEKELLERTIYPAGLRWGMSFKTGYPCAALNAWYLREVVSS